MEKLRSDLFDWSESLNSFHLPRWEELPTLELYMDQSHYVDRSVSCRR